MVADGLWLSRKQRRSFHQPRLRRESYGELVQIDGSDHRWFENRGEPCTLPGFMKQFNEKFSLPAVKAENLHRRLNVQAPRLADILCHREQRHVGQQLSL